VVRQLAKGLVATPVLVAEETRSVDREIVHEGGLSRGAEQGAPAVQRFRQRRILGDEDPRARGGYDRR